MQRGDALQREHWGRASRGGVADFEYRHFFREAGWVTNDLSAEDDRPPLRHVLAPMVRAAVSISVGSKTKMRGRLLAESGAVTLIDDKVNSFYIDNRK